MTPTEAVVPNHSEIDPRYTWNATSVFPSVEAWEAEFERVAGDLAGLQRSRAIWQMARQPWRMPWRRCRA